MRAEIVILGRGDPKAREGTLRTTVERMAAVENALYGNRTLSGTCRRVSVAEATPFSYSPGGEQEARVARRREARLCHRKDGDARRVGPAIVECTKYN